MGQPAASNQRATPRPAFQVSLRHGFGALPIPSLVRHHGTISGHVFRDDASSGRYSPELPPLALV